MSRAASRRGFLSDLATLPLIGGSVALIGTPSAAAVPVTDALLDSYDCWLEYERRWLQWERYGNRETIHRLSLPFRSEMEGRECDFDCIPMANGGSRFHGLGDAPKAETRAALVLSTVGCDWREGGL